MNTDFEENILSCPICMCRYNSATSVPYVICHGGHTICSGCKGSIQERVQHGRGINVMDTGSCPICRSLILHSGGIVNRVLLSYLDAGSNSSSNNNCKPSNVDDQDASTEVDLSSGFVGSVPDQKISANLPDLATNCHSNISVEGELSNIEATAEKEVCDKSIASDSEADTSGGNQPAVQIPISIPTEDGQRSSFYGMFDEVIENNLVTNWIGRLTLQCVADDRIYAEYKVKNYNTGNYVQIVSKKEDEGTGPIKLIGHISWTDANSPEDLLSEYREYDPNHYDSFMAQRAAGIFNYGAVSRHGVEILVGTFTPGTNKLCLRGIAVRQKDPVIAATGYLFYCSPDGKYLRGNCRSLSEQFDSKIIVMASLKVAEVNSHF